MTSESSVELPVDVKPGGWIKRLIDVVVWAASIISIGFTTCYAYHIGF